MRTTYRTHVQEAKCFGMAYVGVFVIYTSAVYFSYNARAQNQSLGD